MSIPPRLLAEAAWRRLKAALALLLLLCAGAAAAQEASEYELKAAFLYNFAGYVEWPAQRLGAPGDPIVFAVAGADQLAEDLEVMVAGRAVIGRPIEVRRLQTGDNLAGVHILFAGAPVGEADLNLLEAAVGQSILTVTESEGVRPAGSVINFEIVDGRVRFDVSLTVARQAGLQISSRLLQVALRVLGANP